MNADVAVHALAQLPDGVSVEAIGSRSEARRALNIARAYGIEDRAHLKNSPGKDGWSGVRFSLDGMERLSAAGSFAYLLHDVAGTAATPTRQGDDAVLAGARIALITNQPAHYRIPLFTGLDERLKAVGASFHVYFLERTPTSRPWLEGQPATFSSEYLPSLTLPVRRHRRPTVPWRLASSFARFEPTIVVSAGLSPLVTGRAARLARQAGAAVGVWCGEIGASPAARNRVRGVMRRRVLLGADFAIAYGFMSAQYLRALAPSMPVVIGRNSSPLPPRTSGSRIGSRPTLIAVGDLATSRKGLDVAVEALSLVPDLDCELRLIGGGRLLDELTSSARADPRIAVLGPLSAAQTREEMARSDIYLFPTRFDVFGLSLVEAMGCGLASVVTRSAGAVEDLCVPDTNCVLVDSHEPEAWASAITRLMEDADFRASLGDSAAATVAGRWTLEHAVDAMMAGLRLGTKALR